MNKTFSIAMLALVLTTMVSATTSSGFRNGVVVTLNYTAVNKCAPTPAVTFNGYPEAVNATAVTNCVIGNPVAIPSNSSALYLLVPTFAGLSVYGQIGWNSTTQGYPTFMGNTLVTQCGAAGSPTGCANAANSIANYYSPIISLWERTLGITSGKFGLPEGVLPNAAHDKLIPNITSGYTYLARVSVLDPNIYPNATTGKCTQVVASNLSNPTANCLNSTVALGRALLTRDTASATANKNNPVYNGRVLQPVQAVIGLVNFTTYMQYGIVMYNITYPTTTKLNVSNLNAVRYLTNVVLAPPPTTVATTAATTAATTVATTMATTVATTVPTTVPVQTTTNSTTTQPASSGLPTWAIVAGVVIVLLIIVAYLMMGKKK